MLASSKPSSCMLDPIPTKLFKEVFPLITSPILVMINLSCKVGCMVVQLPCSKKVLGSIQFSSIASSLSAWSLHVLPMHVWVLTGYSGFLPQSKDIPVNWSL
ncbi:hypothetical protein GOODEAATRI_034099 [Goodea atripinnis]|uniref:Uncharacterized protein n=1 Tax=Goodea atripinnis TaxID=208336 RepID=A0ABV0NG01_9TELE